MNILIINGPNLNLLGVREPQIYGTSSYEDLVKYLENISKQSGVDLQFFQSNHEGAIIDKLHQAYFQKVDAIIINPGAYTHYSYAIRDAIAAVGIPTVEVHLTNINHRESFRSTSVIADVCKKQFMGKGFNSYQEGLLYLIGEEKWN
jgi:3-dehydroquinate dehydratase-2